MLKEYIEAVLVQEQHSLINPQIFNFVQVFLDKCQQPIPLEKIAIAIENALTALADTTNGMDTILQETAPPIALPATVTIHRELERLPISFSRTRGVRNFFPF